MRLVHGRAVHNCPQLQLLLLMPKQQSLAKVIGVFTWLALYMKDFFQCAKNPHALCNSLHL